MSWIRFIYAVESKLRSFDRGNREMYFENVILLNSNFKIAVIFKSFENVLILKFK